MTNEYIKQVIDEVSDELNKKLDNGDTVTSSDFYQLFMTAMQGEEDEMLRM